VKAVGRPMETWVTLYTHEINPSRKTASPGFRDCDPPLASFLDQNYNDNCRSGSRPQNGRN